MPVMDRFMLSADNAALIIVDIQERLVPAMSHRDPVIANTLHLIEAAKLLELPIIITEQYPSGLGLTVDEIESALPSYNPIEKITFGCCGQDTFNEAVMATDRRQLIVAGMETHVCVLQTVLGLLDADYTVHLVGDAVCSRKKSDFGAGLAMARDAGAVVTSTEIVLFQLLERAGTAEFKTISKRIK